MSSTEFMEWVDYFRVYPFRDTAEEVRTAKLRETIMQMAGKVLKKPVSWQKLLPDYYREEEDKPKSVINQSSIDKVKSMFKSIGKK